MAKGPFFHRHHPVKRLAAVFLALLGTAWGTAYTWTNLGGVHDWTNAANWDQGSGFPDGPGDVAIITNALTADQLIVLNSNITLGGLTLGSANGSNITLAPGSGGRLTLSNASGQVLLMRPVMAPGLDFISNEIILASDLLVSNLGLGDIRFYGPIAEIGGRGLDLHGAATAVIALFGSNTYSGGTRIETGPITLGTLHGGTPAAIAWGPLGTGPVTVYGSGASLRVAGLVDAVVMNPVTLGADVAFVANSAGTSLFFSGPLNLSNGNRALTAWVGTNSPTAAVYFQSNVTGDGIKLTGGGRVTFTASNSFSNGLYISPGTSLFVSNTNGLGTGSVTNDGMLVLTATNGPTGNNAYSGLATNFFGTGTNVVMPCALGTGVVIIGGSGAGFSGTWLLGPGAPTNTGKVRFQVTNHPGCVIHVLTNATAWFRGGDHSATVILYGGNTQEPYGQLRADTGARVLGTVFIAGAMEGSNRGHIGSANALGGLLAGPIVETNGAWGLSKTGTGANTLLGTNHFSGPVIVMGGTLVVTNHGWTNGGALGSNTTLILSNNSTVMVELVGNSNHVGALVGGGPLGGEIRLGGGVLGVGYNSGSATNAAFEGLITGTGSLIKYGSNNLILQNTNSYVGPTWLDGGLLQVGPGSCLGTGVVVITNQAIRLMLTNGTVLTNNLALKGGFSAPGRGIVEASFPGIGSVSNSIIGISNAVASGGFLSSSAGGILAVFSTIDSGLTVTPRFGNVTFFGGGGTFSSISVGDGVCGIGTTNGLPTNITVSIASASRGGTTRTYLDLAGYDQTLFRVSEGNGTNNLPLIANSSTTRDSTLTLFGTMTNTASILDAFTNGTRKVHLVVAGGTNASCGSNFYSGSTTIRSGILRAMVPWSPGQYGAFGSNAPMILSNTPNARLDLNGFDNAVGSLTGGGAAGGNVTLGSANLFVGGDGTSPGPYAGVISGTGGLVKTGTGMLTLSGTNTYTGPTHVAGGTLSVDGSIPVGGTVWVSNGGTLAGSGAVGSVTVFPGGTLAPGAGTNFFTLRVSNLTWSNGSWFSLKMNGTGPDSDRVVATGVASCGGFLSITQVTNAASNQVFEILQAPGVTGTFPGLGEGTLFSQQNRTFRIHYTSTNITLRDMGPGILIPAVMVTNPVPFVTNGGGVVFSGVATNNFTNSAFPTVWVSTNGGAYSNFSTGPGWNLALNTSNLPDGTNLLTFMALTTNGASNSVLLTNIVDNTPPGAPTFGGNTAAFYETLAVTLSAADPYGIRCIYYTVDGSSPSTNSSFVTNGGEIVLSNTTTLAAIAMDVAGNMGPRQVSTFTKTANVAGTGAIRAITPNPFRPGGDPLVITVDRKALESMELVVLDIAGRQVAELKATGDPARYQIMFTWDGKITGGRTAGRGLYRIMPRVGGVLQIEAGRRLYVN